MIITSQFVMLNNPKTGSTFVRNMLEEVFEKRGESLTRITMTRKRGKVLYLLWRMGLWSDPVEIHFRKIQEPQRADQHGTVQQIPVKHRDKVIRSVIRHPLDRYVSFYFYGWWKKFDIAQDEALHEKLPDFPDISFEEYLKVFVPYNLYHREYPMYNLKKDADIGLQTVGFARMFSTDPEAMLNQLSEDFISGGEFRQYLPEDMGFLKTESLNRDLVKFLKEMGYETHNIAFIEDQGKIKPDDTSKQRPDEQKWQQYYTEELYDLAVEYEKYLLMMLRELGVGYRV